MIREQRPGPAQGCALAMVLSGLIWAWIIVLLIWRFG